MLEIIENVARVEVSSGKITRNRNLPVQVHLILGHDVVRQTGSSKLLKPNNDIVSYVEHERPVSDFQDDVVKPTENALSLSGDFVVDDRGPSPCIENMVPMSVLCFPSIPPVLDALGEKVQVWPNFFGGVILIHPHSIIGGL